MPRIVHHSVEAPRPCSYLPGEQASLEHKVMVDVGVAEYQAMLERGWRRFGPVYFRPACDPCRACVSLRIDVARFEPSRSQRRAAKRCAHFRRVEGPPGLDRARLALYSQWHDFREEVREWPADRMDPQSYFQQFAFPHPAAREVAWYDDDAPGPHGPRLVAVSLRDETPSALSLVYFFYSPDIAHASPGVANIVHAVEDARVRGIPHVYLGYRVEACPSLRYKGNYGPHELLEERPGPGDDVAPRWRPAPPSPTSKAAGGDTE